MSEKQEIIARDLQELTTESVVMSLLDGAEDEERKAKAEASRILHYQRNGGYYNAGLAHSIRVGHHTQFARALRNTAEQLERSDVQ